jgi:hypothetical protein
MSPPSTTCPENFSLPGQLIVTSHFDLFNSSDANSVIVVMRAVVATTVTEVMLHRLPPCGCVDAQPTKSGRPHRIFFSALDALAVDDRGGRAASQEAAWRRFA